MRRVFVVPRRQRQLDRDLAAVAAASADKYGLSDQTTLTSLAIPSQAAQVGGVKSVGNQIGHRSSHQTAVCISEQTRSLGVHVADPSGGIDRDDRVVRRVRHRPEPRLAATQIRLSLLARHQRAQLCSGRTDEVPETGSPGGLLAGQELQHGEHLVVGAHRHDQGSAQARCSRSVSAPERRDIRVDVLGPAGSPVLPHRAQQRLPWTELRREARLPEGLEPGLPLVPHGSTNQDLAGLVGKPHLSDDPVPCLAEESKGGGEGRFDARCAALIASARSCDSFSCSYASASPWSAIATPQSTGRGAPPSHKLGVPEQERQYRR